MTIDIVKNIQRRIYCAEKKYLERSGSMERKQAASAFYTSGRGLYYFHAPSGSPELDFLTEDEGDVTIVECKATNNRATSMKYVIANPTKYGKYRAIKFSDTNIGGGDGFDTYPLYAAEFITKDQKRNVVPEVEVGKLKIPDNAALL
ncbi:MAG: hypothetical protein IJT05_01710 [Lachnospiraceae bacterium]|nr:hypothetical protein [Lachnospiraceae bacterium]